MATFRSLKAPVANHAKVYATGRTAFAIALLASVVIRLLFGLPDADGPRGWFGLLGYASIFAATTVAIASLC